MEGKKEVSYFCKAPLKTNRAFKAQSVGGMDECGCHCEGVGRRGGDETAEENKGGPQRGGEDVRPGGTQSVQNMFVQLNA